MPSLYHHEHISHTYAELTDEELHSHALELHKMSQETDVPRQLGVIARLLNQLSFEVGCRVVEADGVFGDGTIAA